MQANRGLEGACKASAEVRGANTRLTMKTATEGKFEGFRAKGVKASNADTPKKALKAARKAAEAMRDASAKLAEKVGELQATSELDERKKWDERARIWDESKAVLTVLSDGICDYLQNFFDAPCFSRLRERDLINERVQYGAERVGRALREGVQK